MTDMRHWMTLMETAEASWLTDPLSDPAFRKWFGNSVIRDSNGQPLKVYHGTPRSFDSFSMTDATAGMLYFATDPHFASGYASTVNQGLKRGIHALLDRRHPFLSRQRVLNRRSPKLGEAQS